MYPQAAMKFHISKKGNYDKFKGGVPVSGCRMCEHNPWMRDFHLNYTAPLPGSGYKKRSNSSWWIGRENASETI